MKVLLVNKFHYMKGGSETYYFALVNLLIKKGDNVVCFALDDQKNQSTGNLYTVNNVDFNKDNSLFNKIKLAKNIKYSKSNYNQMKKVLEIEKPNLVILNLVHRQITLSIVDAIKDFNPNIKIFWVMHDLIYVCPRASMMNGNYEICERCSQGKFFNCVKYRCIKKSYLKSWLAYSEAKFIKTKKLYDKIDLFISPSKCHTNIFKKSSFTKSKIIHLKNFLPIDFQFEKKCVNGNYILYFGRLSRDKGIYNVIDSIKNTNYKLVIAGNGEEKENILNLIKEHNLSNIEYVGFKQGNELKELIINSKAVILMSEWYENCPYSIMESMGYSKPLIVSNIGGLPELVENGVNGYLCDPGDSDKLKQVIDKLYSLSNSEYEMMCVNSLKMAIDLFDYNKYYKKFMSNYYDSKEMNICKYMK